MKILFVNGAHPDDKIGGAELQSWLLAKSLADRHNVTFLAVRSETDRDKICTQDGVSIVRLARTRKFSLQEFRRIYRSVARISPDLVHLRMFDYIYLFRCISRRLRIPIVYHVSSMYNCMPIRPGPQRQIVRRIRHLINNRLMRRMSGLVCQTHDQRKLIGRTGRMSAVVRNSALGNWEAGSTKDERLILWVGNIKSLKRPLDFIRIAANFRDTPFRFLMIGYPQDEALTDKVIEYASNLDNLEYIPGVPVADIIPYFQRASVLVSTSEVEGYPNTFIQAIQSATPVVSLKLDPDKVLADCHVGECVRDLGELAARLTALLHDKTRLESMRQNTKRCFTENFDIAHNAKKLELFFETVLSQ